MVIVLCECPWGISGIDRLPPHLHRRWALVRSNGREVRVNHHDVALNPEWEVIAEGEDIHIAVDWKEVARRGPA